MGKVPNKERAKLSAVMPSELREGLRQLAREHDRSASAELRLAIRQHLGASPPPTTATPEDEAAR